MIYTLPKSVEIDGKQHPIRYHYAVILEIIEMLNDSELSDAEKAEALLTMFYVHPEEITDIKAAVKACFDFMDNGTKSKSKGPKLIDWEQDFNYIIAPVNRVLGYEIRAVEYDPVNNTGGVHWFTFLAAYTEIGGDCALSQIVNIRDKRARGKKLEKYEQEWYRKNKDIVDIKTKYTSKDDELLKQWTGGG